MFKERFDRICRLVKTNHGTHRGYIRHLLAQAVGIAGPENRFRLIEPGKIDCLVFVCLGNINRSAFAHVVADHARVHCISIGLATTAGAPATEMARSLAPEHGLSLDSH